eukprot:GCRY01001628.1.p1 GENE.GCRY01001628.1~~GCRY01001628.1.p1  ORF type:complete len:311 (+),score=79.76 GCRY01001628.1:301-1233(+)
MDCSIEPTGIKDVFLVSTIDFFYPLVNHPEMQGRIACANVLSDLYAMGIQKVDTMLMTLAVSRQMNDVEQDVVTRLMIKGFNDLAKEGCTKVTGGQTVKNPWPIIGGVASSVLAEHQFIRPEHAVPGDVLVLTKPLGCQVFSNLNVWHIHQRPRWHDVKHLFPSESEFDRAIKTTMLSMARLNRVGAELMMKYGAHAATDITGFGLIGHAQNMASAQTAAVDFRIHTLPCLPYMYQVNAIANFGLREGTAAETSGGLFVALPRENAQAFIDEIYDREGWPAWIVGEVLPRSQNPDQNTAFIVDEPTIYTL